jgi:3-dehydroquinate synthase
MTVSHMHTLQVSLGERSYPIVIGSGLLNNTALLAEHILAKQVLIVTNEIVAPLYLETLQRGIPADETHALVLPDGEEQKSLQTFSRIIDELMERGFHRDACVIALGGGVIGDVSGFAASCFQRGITFVQVPTTLLSQVDSSVGGKTAVNHVNGKNMIGAFYQPSCVLADTATLATLPPREFAAGLAEVIKHSLILDFEFFKWLEAHLDDLLTMDAAALNLVVRKNCELKAAIVAEDEREHGRRALLNFGHTFGHALESLSGYGQLLHGEAVSIGMSLAARTSAQLGKLNDADCERIENLLVKAGLPVSAPQVEVELLLERMYMDKKASAAGLNLVLLGQLGEGVITAAPAKALLRSVIETQLAA